MRKLTAVLFVAILFFCGCNPEADVTQHPTPSQTVPPKQDAVSEMFPLHLTSDGCLTRVYMSSSKPVSVRLKENVTFYYSGDKYETVKYSRENDQLIFCADYSVSKGRVYCKLYRYDGSLQLMADEVLATSVIFASDGLAYISKDELYCYRYVEGNAQSVAKNVSACFFIGTGADSLVYVSDAKIYYNGVVLDVCAGEASATNGAIIVNKEEHGGYCDIDVIFTNGNSFSVDYVDMSFGYVDGYLLTKNGLVYLDGEDRHNYRDKYVVEVQGGEGVVGYDNGKCTYYFKGSTRQLNIDSLVLEAYFVRGRLLIKTEDWLYDGSSKIGNPYKVKHLDSDLYMLYKNSDKVTAVIRKLDGTSPVADKALADMPIYSVGGKIAYFVKQSFTKEIYRIRIGKELYFDNADPSIAPKGNSQLTEILFYRDGYPVVYYHGKEYEFKNCKIYL